MKRFYPHPFVRFTGAWSLACSMRVFDGFYGFVGFVHGGALVVDVGRIVPLPIIHTALASLEKKTASMVVSKNSAILKARFKEGLYFPSELEGGWRSCMWTMVSMWVRGEGF